MSNPNMEAQIKELLELKRLKEELEAEIASAEDEIKAVMGDEEVLLAGAFKVTWTPYTSTRFDSTRFKKEHATSLPLIPRRPRHAASPYDKSRNTYHSIPASATQELITEPGSISILPHWNAPHKMKGAKKDGSLSGSHQPHHGTARKRPDFLAEALDKRRERHQPRDW